MITPVEARLPDQLIVAPVVVRLVAETLLTLRAGWVPVAAATAF